MLIERCLFFTAPPPAHQFEWDIQLLFTIESAALLMAIIIAAAGYIYYKIKTSGL